MKIEDILKKQGKLYKDLPSNEIVKEYNETIEKPKTTEEKMEMREELKEYAISKGVPKSKIEDYVSTLENFLEQHEIDLEEYRKILALSALTGEYTGSTITLLLKARALPEKVEDLKNKAKAILGEKYVFSEWTFLYKVRHLIDVDILELEDGNIKELEKVCVKLTELGKEIADSIKKPFFTAYAIKEEHLYELAKK